ncbi:MAG: exodeoxyribonuclease VII large subunit, partial [Chloroflexota bacterium]
MNIYRVSEVNSHIRFILEGDPTLSDLWLQGEVSNFTRATSGHLYFTLKDEKAQISCVMWRSLADRQEYLPQSGQAIVAHGHISVYEVQGRYQFYVDDIQPAGVGLLHLEYERRKKELEAEGLFAEELKRPLPTFPKRIGIVTSRVGAALRDVLHVLNRRYPLVEVILAPTMVQGNEAPPQIIQAIRALNEHADVDLIIVTRGGGSLEDLWAFNDV